MEPRPWRRLADGLPYATDDYGSRWGAMAGEPSPWEETMSKAGQLLSDEQIAEYEYYRERGLTPPDEFDGVVFDATGIQGAQWRWRTADEEKAAEAFAEDERKRAELREKVVAKVEKRLGDARGANEMSGVRAPVADAGAPGAGTASGAAAAAKRP